MSKKNINILDIYQEIKPKNYKLDKRITNREFKILLIPDRLDRHSEIDRVQRIVINLAQKMNVLFTVPDSISPGLRNVYFFDTDDESFRRNKLIMRVRETRSNIWTDEWCEVTLKCRSDDIERSWSHDPMPVSGLRFRKRFKEEILKDGQLGSIRKIYSHNSIMETVPIDRIYDRKLSDLSLVYPSLKNVNLPFEKVATTVGGKTNKILEAQVNLGNISFSNDIHAHCDLAIWFRTVGEPIVGELAFAYRVHKKNRDDISGHMLADNFFRQLQLELNDSVFSGTTKTALVYGSKE